ncbi:uncharacterized protein LOC119382004 [Rhipicephalus sanguineus]|uniref:uncharacterized protein LOC119382004 n=1 Tax=Rhipicephalus sanguineus TaxID=34632 RepID=UPI001893B5E1|nr:uncharacterized protein LOC119382004 [Rhipicephalus sanguineus]
MPRQSTPNAPPGITMNCGTVSLWHVISFISFICATEGKTIVYPRMLQSRSDDGVKMLKINDDITLNLRKSSVFSEEFLIHTTKDGEPIAYHMLGAEMEKNIYDDSDQMAAVHVTEEDGLSVVSTVSENFKLPFELNTDASYYGTGAVLYQRGADCPRGRQQRVVGYYSYTFSKAQLNYTTTEKEALAVLMAVRYFRPYLDGRSFTLFTDHQALTYILNLAEPRGKIARWVAELQPFTFVVHHRPGEHLKDADALSRLAVIPDQENINANLLWEGTEELQFLNGKFAVPETMVPRILELYHDSPHSGGHDGFWRTYRKIHQRFQWKHMKDDVQRLGCAHDGDGAERWPYGHIGSKDCDWNTGYMMSYKFKKPYMYKFSPCCQREVTNFYNRPEYQCLLVRNSIKTGIFSTRLPGSASSRQVYCEKVYYEYTYVRVDRSYKDRVCMVKCIVSREGESWYISAVDGVKCGRGKICVLGNCTSKAELKKAE